MNHAVLIASTLCFLLGFGYVLFALGARAYGASRFHFVVLAAGFALQTIFLYQRGQVIGRCPLTNLFEVLVFLSWAVVLFYLVIGPSYRLSLLGAFTAPLAFALQIVALISGLDSISARIPVNPYLEFHAAFSLLAYGAFVLAGLAGAMYLLQERQLKTHRLTPAFFALPPIHSLGVANGRLITVGFLLLTLGMLAGFGVGRAPSPFKLGWSIGVWLLYGAILAARWLKHLAPRRVANLSVFASCLAIATLWGITFIGDQKAADEGNSKLEIRSSKEIVESLQGKTALDAPFAQHAADEGNSKLEIRSSKKLAESLKGKTALDAPFAQHAADEGNSKLEIRSSKKLAEGLQGKTALDAPFAQHAAGQALAFDFRLSTFDAFLRVSSFELRVSASAAAAAAA